MRNSWARSTQTWGISPSHYEILGVADGADPEAVRRAYLELARRLHPDRWIDASADERADAHRRMQEVNEAWRVLGNPARRLAYDTGRRRHADEQRAATATAAGPGRPFTSGDLFLDDRPPPDAVTRIIRFLPWAAVFLVLGAIFVFTAYATGGDDAPSSCVRPDGGTAVSVPCEAGGAREVELRVPDVSQCPAGTEPFQPAGEAQAFCLRR